MDQSLVIRIQSLGNDLQQKILSYTYSPQNYDLLYDIQDYTYSLDTAEEYYFAKYMIEIEDFQYKTDLNWFLDDIFEYISNNIFRIHYYDFWRRLFRLRNKSDEDINHYIATAFYEKTIENQINILWGLLTPEERGDVIYFGIELIDTESEAENDIRDDDFDF